VGWPRQQAHRGAPRRRARAFSRPACPAQQTAHAGLSPALSRPRRAGRAPSASMPTAAPRVAEPTWRRARCRRPACPSRPPVAARRWASRPPLARVMTEWCRVRSLPALRCRLSAVGHTTSPPARRPERPENGRSSMRKLWSSRQALPPARPPGRAAPPRTGQPPAQAVRASAPAHAVPPPEREPEARAPPSATEPGSAVAESALPSAATASTDRDSPADRRPRGCRDARTAPRARACRSARSCRPPTPPARRHPSQPRSRRDARASPSTRLPSRWPRPFRSYRRSPRTSPCRSQEPAPRPGDLLRCRRPGAGRPRTGRSRRRTAQAPHPPPATSRRGRSGAARTRRGRQRRRGGAWASPCWRF
jgi:hypothetical protein